MRKIVIAAGLAVLLGLAPALLAEKPTMSPEAMRKIATHVVSGTVRGVYSKAERDGGMRVTRYVAEVEVGEVEKGEGIGKGELIYVRYWTQEWMGSMETMPAGTTGHRNLPKEGETLRIYLARNARDGFVETTDGGLNVIGANGFERPRAADGG